MCRTYLILKRSLYRRSLQARTLVDAKEYLTNKAKYTWMPMQVSVYNDRIKRVPTRCSYAIYRRKLKQEMVFELWRWRKSSAGRSVCSTSFPWPYPLRTCASRAEAWQFSNSHWMRHCGLHLANDRWKSLYTMIAWGWGECNVVSTQLTCGFDSRIIIVALCVLHVTSRFWFTRFRLCEGGVTPRVG